MEELQNSWELEFGMSQGMQRRTLHRTQTDCCSSCTSCSREWKQEKGCMIHTRTRNWRGRGRGDDHVEDRVCETCEWNGADL